MIYSIKCFLEINEYTTGKMFFVKSFSYFFCDLKSGMHCRVFILDSLLFIIKYIVIFMKNIKTLVNKVLHYFTHIWYQWNRSVVVALQEVSFFEYWDYCCKFEGFREYSCFKRKIDEFFDWYTDFLVKLFQKSGRNAIRLISLCMFRVLIMSSISSVFVNVTMKVL